jgi:hypothetical protein
VSHSTTRRESPSPKAYAFGVLVRSLTSSTLTGIDGRSWAALSRRASAAVTESGCSSPGVRYGPDHANSAASATNAAAPGSHQAERSRRASVIATSSAKQMNRNSPPSAKKLSTTNST